MVFKSFEFIFKCKKNNYSLINMKSLAFIIAYILISSHGTFRLSFISNLIFCIPLLLCTTFSLFNPEYKLHLNLERILSIIVFFFTFSSTTALGVFCLISLFFFKVKHHSMLKERATIDSEWTCEICHLLPLLLLFEGALVFFFGSIAKLPTEIMITSILSIGALFYFKAGINKPNPLGNDMMWTLIDSAFIQWNWLSSKWLIPVRKSLSKFAFSQCRLCMVFSYIAECGFILAIVNDSFGLAFCSLAILFHLLIFLCTGIFFWKWICINFFLISLIAIMPYSFSLTEIVFVVLLFAFNYRSAIGLHWWNAPVAHETFFKVTEKNEESFRIHPKSFGYLGLEIVQFNKFQGLLKESNYLKIFKTLGVTTSKNDFRNAVQAKDEEAFKKCFQATITFDQVLYDRFMKVFLIYLEQSEIMNSFFWNKYLREPLHLWVGYPQRGIVFENLLSVQLVHNFYMLEKPNQKGNLVLSHSQTIR